MMKKEINKKLDRVSKTSLSEKQSVRTTFKLSESSNETINWLIKTTSLKPKEIFEVICSNENLINLAIELAKKNEINSSLKQIRKTFVISKRVLRLLNRLSEKHKLSRDLLIEALILHFKNLLEMNAEEEKRQEKKALTIVSDFISKAEATEEKLKDILDEDSPILDRFGYVIIILMNLENAIKSKLTHGVPIDPDDFSQS